MTHRPRRAPALIVTDLDGTFLSPDGTVSDLNSAAVVAAAEAGIPVLFATGRPIRWLEVIASLPGSHPTVIASNGAVLHDLGTGVTLDRICIDPDVALAAVRDIRRVVPDAAFAFETGSRFGYESHYWIDWAANVWRGDHPDNPALVSGNADDLAYAEPFVKLLVQSRSVAADELLDRVRSAVGDRLTATHSQARAAGLVEIGAYGVSKAAMLQRCCDRLGIDAGRVAAFGDMPNDVEMLSWAGTGFVVRNGHPSLLDREFAVVPANSDSGVGRTILELLSL